MGMLEDILGDIKARQAATELQREGSVMSRRPSSERSLLEDLLYSLTGGSAEGFIGGGGVLGPIRTQGQKQIAKTLAKFPELLKEAVASKRMLHIAAPQPVEKAAKGMAKAVLPEGIGINDRMIRNLVKEMTSRYPEYANYGIYQDALNPSFGGTITINPNTLRGLNPKGQRTATTLPQVGKHELTHFLSAPQTKALTTSQGLDVGESLQKLLPPHGRETVAEHLLSGEGGRAASEALSYLSEVPKAEELFMKLRPNLPTPPAGAKGTFGGISGMGVENKPLYQTLVKLGLIRSNEPSIWDAILRGGK